VDLETEDHLAAGGAWWDFERHVLSLAFPQADRSWFAVRRLPTR